MVAGIVRAMGAVTYKPARKKKKKIAGARVGLRS